SPRRRLQPLEFRRKSRSGTSIPGRPRFVARPGKMPILDGRLTLLMLKPRAAKFKIGQGVRHRLYPLRGGLCDVHPTFNNTEDWWLSTPAEVRPSKDQPFYHLFAENAETEYIAYVSEQNLLPDNSGTPVRHPQVAEVFERDESGSFRPRHSQLN